MRKILVAGAGHGGLAAAYNLAKAGYAVTVLEQKAREEAGYDWLDCISLRTLQTVGVSPLPPEALRPYRPMAYRGPSKDVTLTPDPPKGAVHLKYVDRKVLLRHLIREAEAAGAAVKFGCTVTGPLLSGSRVTGVRYRENGTEKEETADLVIDAAGIRSPLRRSLPDALGIQREIAEEDTLFVYRACYEKTEPRMTEPPCNMYFYHCRRKGLDWMITDEDNADVLVGTFGPVTRQEVCDAVADMRRDFPFVGQRIVRGGSMEAIPLRPPLPRLIADGYALVGDSASMVACLSGSGMDYAMSAGKMLADTVINAGEQPLTAAVLWPYQHTFFKNCGLNTLNDNMLKHFLMDAGASGTDALFRKKILTEREMSGAGRHYTKKELAAKAFALLSTPVLWRPIIKLAEQNRINRKIKQTFPDAYDPAALAAWERIYKV